MSIKDFCYSFLLQNSDHFDDLNKYDTGLHVDTTYLDNYMDINKNSGYEDFYDLIKTILQNTKYINCSDLACIINSNINELILLIENGYKPILIMTNESIDKSNIFYNFYLLNQLKKKNIEIDHIYFSLLDILNYEGEITKIRYEGELKSNNKIIIILCDDVSYSGTQLLEHLIPQKIKINFSDSDIKIFLNIVGLLPKAQKNILSCFINPSDLIIPKSVIIIKEEESCSSFRRCLLNTKGIEYLKNINLKDCYVLEKRNDKIFINKLFYDIRLLHDTKELSLLCLFYKYPDEYSTFPTFCRIPILSGKKILLNLDIFKKNKKFVTYDWFKNNIYNLFNNGIEMNYFFNEIKCIITSDIVDDIYQNFDNHDKLKKYDWLKFYEYNTNIGDISKIYNNNWIVTLKTNTISNIKKKIDYTCNDTIILPFYKKIRYKINNKNISMSDNIYLVITNYNDEEEIDVCNKENFFNKYIKYKKKYIKYKKNYFL